ncbi:MAG TPA: sulfotransferase [Gammaproteobacteria bacterium]|nr:sulfotransferase [Gammaproteobacteria bacterium]
MIGMHRSGTRLLVDVLDRLGVFMGADRQADAESVAFMLMNEEILHQCGAFWSEPMSAHFLLAQPGAAEQLAAHVRESLDARLVSYVGGAGWELRSGALPAFGWKDPRNTFTLPVWKQLFPNLRAIHILRHGVDAAASLARRHAQALRAATGEGVPSALAVIRDRELGVLSSRRGWTLAEALTMWEQYVEKAREECAALGERALEVRYEDLLTRPEAVIPAIAQLCGVRPAAPAEALLGSLDTGRAFAFRRDPELAAFAGSARGVLARYGYTP